MDWSAPDPAQIINFTQPLFLDLCIPRSATPGNYSCADCITVSGAYYSTAAAPPLASAEGIGAATERGERGVAVGSRFSIRIAAVVEVWDISLPALNSSSSFSTVFSLGEGGGVYHAANHSVTGA